MMPGVVTKVRVFEDRVAISRVTRSNDGGGAAVFAPLPETLDPDSIRARIVDAAEGSEARVLGVSVKRVPRPQASTQDELREALKALELDILQLDDEEETERHAASHLQTYAQLAADKLSLDWLGKEPDFDGWSKIFDDFRRTQHNLSEKSAERNERRRQLAVRSADIHEELQRLEERLQPGYSVEVSLAGASAPVSVELSYLSHSGRWRAAYEAKLDDDGVQLVAIADVTQSTGEDWTDVELIASTARPSKSQPPPTLRKIEIQSQEDKGNREVVSSHEREDELEGGPGGGDKAKGPSTVEHVAPGRVSIPSTGRPTRVELFSCELPSRRHLEVTPLIRPIVVEVAKIENTSQFVLLPGRVKVHRTERYSGTARISQVAPGESFKLAVGTEASLRVKRRVHTAPTERGITGAKTMSHEVDIEVHNISAEAQEVLVRDRVPVSRTQDSRVSIKSLDRSIEVDSTTGLTTARIEVGPYERRNLQVVFSLTVPRGVKVRPPGGV